MAHATGSNPSIPSGRPLRGKSDALPAGPERILVAEDELLLARSLKSDLEEMGYKVVGPASNGQTAIDLARAEKPDMALMDIRMPEVDGLAAADVLLHELDIPVVILSAYSDPPYLSAGAEMNVYGYLLKPVSMDELRVSLTVAWSRYLEQRKLTGEVEELKIKLEQRKTVERAKGLLMKHEGMDEEQAMRSLQKHARDARLPMIDLARQVIVRHQSPRQD